jgi:tetratricopeptide (TPR) repeat protein
VKPTFEILIGNNDEQIQKMLLEALQQALGADFDLQITTLKHIKQLNKAANNKYDLCILAFNGIIVPHTKSQPSANFHVDQILHFIAALKANHRTPVIVFSTFSDSDIRERVGYAGTDFYFTLPLEPDRLKKVILKCVKMMGKMPDQFSKLFHPLPHSEQHHLEAAEGWLELGNHLEANEKLERIEASLRAHPDVLELRWQIYAKAKKWEECVLIGQALVNSAPARPDSWIHRSYALHELKRTEEASDLLLAAADLFPGLWLIMYNLACYASCLGNLEEAWDWLQDAFDLGDAKKVKSMALEDKDLENLWGEIGEI